MGWGRRDHAKRKEDFLIGIIRTDESRMRSAALKILGTKVASRFK